MRDTRRHMRTPTDTLRTLAASVDTAITLLGSRRMHIDDLDWQLVAAAVRERMDTLLLSQAALADAADVSPITLRHLRNATQESYRRDSLIKVSTALGLGADGLARIGRGTATLEQVMQHAAENDLDVDAIELLLGIRDRVNDVGDKVTELEERLADVERAVGSGSRTRE